MDFTCNCGCTFNEADYTVYGMEDDVMVVCPDCEAVYHIIED